MKNILCALLLLPMSLMAQEQESVPAQPVVPAPAFGYVSYNAVFQQMPDYQKACQDFQQLKAKYDAEASRAEEEFQRKFAEFLQGQKDFPQSIMLKRQAELQELMEKSINFRQQSRELLRNAESDLQQPVAARLAEAIRAVGAERRLLFILNTDGNACPYVDATAGADVTADVQAKLGIVAENQE